MIKKSFYLLLFSITIGFKATGEMTSSDQDQKQDHQNYQQLQVKKAKTLHFSPEEAARMKTELEDSFSKGYENSSPEVKAALLKAAKEVREKESQEKQLSE